jgi:hypothetical protein
MPKSIKLAAHNRHVAAGAKFAAYRSGETMRDRSISRLRRPYASRLLFCAPFALSLALYIGNSAASDQIYSFVDEQGIVHLSNVPADPRYQVTGQVMQPNTRLVSAPSTSEPQLNGEPLRETEHEPWPPPPAGDEQFAPMPEPRVSPLNQ